MTMKNGSPVEEDIFKIIIPLVPQKDRGDYGKTVEKTVGETVEKTTQKATQKTVEKLLNAIRENPYVTTN